MSVVTFGASASNTYYSQIQVSAPSGQGYVYASTSGTVDDALIASSEYSNIYQSESATGSATHTWYLHAKAEKGYIFEQWSNGSTDNPTKVEIKTSATEKGSPATAQYSASFVPTYVTISNSDPSLGTATISKLVNAPGDVVTLEATLYRPQGSSEFSQTTRPSKSAKFEGWFNDRGEKVSDDLQVSYTVKEVEVLEARFSREFAIKTDENGKIYGYYRLQTPFFALDQNYFLCLTGGFKVSITGVGDRYLYGAVEFNQVNDANYAKEAAFADAGSVFYVTGTANMKNIHAVDSRTEVATNIIAEAQGTSTDVIVGGKALSLNTASTPGYYIIKYGSVSLQLTYGKKVWVTTDKPTNDSYKNAGDLDVQPVDLEHIDTNYFGAYPDASMEYDGGYWTSMYTSFPYECYEPDGVEAYVVSEVYNDDEGSIALIRRLESGIVPAATPVLLKCQGLSPKENRLIPLMPDDSRLPFAAEEVGENLLTGEYGLWADSSYGGRARYNPETMRVFSVNSVGDLGFYKLAPNEDGSQQELVPNRAFFDLNKVPAAKRAAAFRIKFDSGDLGESSVGSIVDTSVDNETEIFYNLQGFEVKEPVRGNVYIVRKGSKTRKIVY